MPSRPISTFTHVKALDGFRGMAILFVLAGHTLYFSLGLSRNWEALGGAGVTLFFALSGFLITGLLCKEEAETGTVNLLGFYRSRCLRIFPAYYVLLAITALLMGLKLVTDVPWYALAVCALHLRNIFGRGETLTHAWTLSLEQQFYALWPIVVKRLGCRALLFWAVGATLAITLWRTAAITFHLWDYNAGRFYVRPDFRFDSILIGCCLALWFFGSPASASPRLLATMHRVARFAHPAWVLPALVFWTYATASCVTLRPFIITLQNLLTGLLLLNVVLQAKSRWATWLSGKWIGTFGKVSYSIYLWQQIFIVTKLPSWGMVRVFPVDLLLACLAGVASYYLVELPFLQWKRRLTVSSQPVERPAPVLTA